MCSIMKSVIFLLVLFVTSTFGRISVKYENVPNVSSNLIDNNKVTRSIVHPALSTTESTNANEVIEYTSVKPISKIDNNSINDDTSSVVTTTEGQKKCVHIIHSKVGEITDNNIDSVDNEPCEVRGKVNNGTALILTPYIEEGRIEEARKACVVDPKHFLGVSSYSGFLTVNKTYDSNLFFWYFPVENKRLNETPWIIWLQGGPGASSMTGLFDEIGPFNVDNNGTLRKNPYTWLKNHSLLFIDNPVGTGYSFTNHRNGFVKNMATYGGHLYIALKQFLELFPELRKAPLFIAGESYAGKYVPSLGLEIHNNKNSPGGDINLQGLIIGNAYVDPAMISQLSRPFYYFGLLVKEQIEIVKPLLDSFNQAIAANKSIEAKEKWNSLITVLLFLTHQKHAYNFLRDDLSVGKYISFLRRSEVKRAIHVGDIKFGFVNLTVNSELAPDFLSSSKPKFEKLLDFYRVLAYCGQLDQMLPCIFTSDNYRTWKWNASKEFLEATRFPYIFNNKLAGYHKSGGHLTEVMVRGAGHMVPLDAPAPAQSLVARWTHDQPLSRRFSLLEGSFVQEYVKNNSIAHYL